MTIITCPIEGTYLVQPDGPIPVGQTASSASVVVHKYDFGWVCNECLPTINTTRTFCLHVRKVQESINAR